MSNLAEGKDASHSHGLSARTHQRLQLLRAEGGLSGALGAVETRYDRTGADGVTEIFIPVFEAKAIFVYSFRAAGEPVECLPDETLGCTECDSPGPPGPP